MGFTFSPVVGQPGRLGEFDNHADIGNVYVKGNAEYNSSTQEFAISGSGSNIWFNHDAFHFLYKKMKGNFLLTANVAFTGKGTELHRKLGWMIRQSLDSTSAHVSSVIHGDGLTSLQFRKSNNSTMEELKFSITAPDVVQLERKGNDFIMSAAHLGEAFTTEKITVENFSDEVYIGLFLCAHNNNVLEKASFSNVRITVPVKDNYVPYKDYIGSNMEMIVVENGKRMVLFDENRSLQAPNWTRDGKALIYNSEGKLYHFDLEKKLSEVINTGFAVNNNNDHVISYDGKMIGISDHTVDKDHNSSFIFFQLEEVNRKQ